MVYASPISTLATVAKPWPRSNKEFCHFARPLKPFLTITPHAFQYRDGSDWVLGYRVDSILCSTSEAREGFHDGGSSEVAVNYVSSMPHCRSSLCETTFRGSVVRNNLLKLIKRIPVLDMGAGVRT